MTDATAEQLDLSRLPPFRLVDVDYEAILASRLASLQARFAAAGIDYDVGMLETDPSVILQQEDAFRQTLDLQALNDAGKRLTAAYGYGAALDHIAATYFADIGVRRMPLAADPKPFATNPEDWEDDDRFRRRIQLAPEARSPFTPGAYVYAALTSSIAIADAVALNHANAPKGMLRPGEVRVAVLAKSGLDHAAQAAIAAAFIRARPIVALTDTVSVVGASRIGAEVRAVLRVRRGPDPAIVRTEAVRRLALYQADRYRLAAPLTVSGLLAALTVGAVEDVTLLSPAATIDPGPTGVVTVDKVDVTTETIGV